MPPQEQRKETKVMAKLWRKIKFVVLLLAGIAVIVVLNVLYQNFQSRRIINGDCLERDLTTIVYSFPEAPNLEERIRPWDSELPELIAEDIEYIRQRPSLKWIEYKFYEWRFYIYIDRDGEEYLGMDGYSHPYMYDVRNFSFYSDGHDKLVFYGYDLNTFECYTFMEEDYDFTYTTYNKTIPFTEKESFAYTRGDYTVCFPDDRDVVYVYRDGKVVSNEYEVPKNSKKLWNGLIITEDSKLEMLYVVESDDDKVKLRFEPVGQLKDAYEGYSSMKVEDIDELYIELPMFNDDDQMIIVAPKDWDTYIASRKGETPENSNYETEFVILDSKTFKRVEFECQKSGVSGYSS